MIGFLLALALVVGCPSVGRAHERAQAAVAMCVEAFVVAAPSVIVERVEIAPQQTRPACIVIVVRHRALDLRSGGLPQPRAPDVEPALSRIG